jgi:hypothetical protein
VVEFRLCASPKFTAPWLVMCTASFLVVLPTVFDIHSSTDVLHSLGTVKVVGVGESIIVKYGDRVRVSEAEAMKFVSRNTSVPVPEVLGTFEHEGKVYICSVSKDSVSTNAWNSWKIANFVHWRMS